jgi:hypothetical protein
VVDVSALSDLINRSLTRKGWGSDSLRTLAARSDNRLSKDTVRAYRSGNHGQPDEEILEAWSQLIDVPIDRLRKAAGIPSGESAPWVAPAEAARLTRRQRDALTELIRSFTDAKEDHRGAPQPGTQAPGQEHRSAGGGREASIEEMQAQAIDSLVRLGFTPERALAVIHERVTGDQGTQRGGMHTDRKGGPKSRGAS